MKYSYIQFLGYEIDTSPSGLFGGQRRYTGIGNTAQDIDLRCQLMEAAIERAYEQRQTGRGLLHLFMAPEFFFRGADGAYDLDDVATVISKLQDLVKAKKWEDWIFVFGTILGVSSKHEAGNPLIVNLGAMHEVYNFALVQRGGFGNDKNLRALWARVVMKEYKSDIDFLGGRAGWGPGLQDGGVQHLEVLERDKNKKKLTRNEVQHRAYDGHGVFDLAGVRFGLETCLDHGVRRLRSHPLARGQTWVQIQLIPSGGMAIQPGAVVTQTGGYVFNVDGTRPGAELKRVDEQKKDPVNMDAKLAVAQAQVGARNVSPVAVNVNRIFPKGAGRVCSYEAVRIPIAKRIS